MVICPTHFKEVVVYGVIHLMQDTTVISEYNNVFKNVNFTYL